MKTVLITGAGGFIAGQLAARCHARSWRVVGTVRRDESPPHFDKTYRCSLGESVRDVLDREQIDAVVHAANFVGPDEYRVNFDGTLRWHEELQQRTSLQILLSSLSALAERPTEYGRAKRDLEARFLSDDDVIVRLGLVAGPGGLFGRMIESVRRSPVLPLLDAGRTPVFLVNPTFLLDFLIQCICDEGGNRRGSIWHLHQPHAHSLREVLDAIRECTGASCRFISLPSALVLPPVAALEALGFRRMPVSSSNIRGLRHSPGDVPCDFHRLGGTDIPLNELVSLAIRHFSDQGDPR